MIAKHTCIVAGLILIFNITTGCGRQGISENNVDDMDSIHVVSMSYNDSTSFKHSGTKQCNVKVNIYCEYPEFQDIDSVSTAIQDLYIKNVLNVDNEKIISIPNALEELSKMTILRYGESIDEVEYSKSSGKNITNYMTNIDIKVIYNKNGLATFCRHEISFRNEMETMSAHNYYSFDLDSLKKIEIFDLFQENDLQDVSELLKNKLLVTLNINDEDSLMNLGYFNLDNITVTDNFYFDETGITWNYPIYEIACFSVGETNITLDYEQLSPYINNRSYLHKYLNRLK